MNRKFALFILSLLLLGGCTGSQNDMGVVALVNGQPIFLNQLEFQHDLLHMGGTGAVVPSVEVLRSEYGRILADLVVLELVEQELEHRGLAVSVEEMAREEEKIRADYPDGAFEQVLIEEYIDLAAWRRQLKYDASRRKFFQEVLRGQVKVDYLEADAYYKEHLQDFRLPESFKMIVLRGAHKEAVERAVAVYRETKSVSTVSAKVSDLAVNELTVTAGQLSLPWKNALGSLPTGEVSPVLETPTGFEALVLLHKAPARMLDATLAYPKVEEALLDRKLAEAFEKWLTTELVVAEIEISTHLLEGASEQLQEDVVEPEEQLQETLPEPDDGPLEDAPEEEEPLNQQAGQ